jgi:hypothetical protein
MQFYTNDPETRQKVKASGHVLEGLFGCMLAPLARTKEALDKQLHEAF